MAYATRADGGERNRPNTFAADSEVHSQGIPSYLALRRSVG
jgi:hypothetical protein